MIEEFVRCPNCGARNPRDLPWCGQCHRSFRPQLAPTQEAAPIDRAAVWTCVRCSGDNTIESTLCERCGATIYDTFTPKMIAGATSRSGFVWLDVIAPWRRADSVASRSLAMLGVVLAALSLVVGLLLSRSGAVVLGLMLVAAAAATWSILVQAALMLATGRPGDALLRPRVLSIAGIIVVLLLMIAAMTEPAEREIAVTSSVGGWRSVLIVADVHGAVDLLRRAAAQPGPLLILGDLINFIDYRTLDGMITDLAGKDLVRRLVDLRTAGDFAAAGALWRRFSQGRESELKHRYEEMVEEAYRSICGALTGASGFVTYGNVDRPEVLMRHLPPGMRFVDGETIEIDGVRVGFAGGGMESPLGVAGEVSEAAMAAKLDLLGDVDVLCTHVPPLVPALAADVIGGRQKGSSAIRDFILERRPSYHYFGDIHQPKAVRWTLGATICRNVGYFRATGKGVRHD